MLYKIAISIGKKVLTTVELTAKDMQEANEKIVKMINIEIKKL